MFSLNLFGNFENGQYELSSGFRGYEAICFEVPLWQKFFKRTRYYCLQNQFSVNHNTFCQISQLLFAIQRNNSTVVYFLFHYHQQLADVPTSTVVSFLLLITKSGPIANNAKISHGRLLTFFFKSSVYTHARTVLVYVVLGVMEYSLI